MNRFRSTFGFAVLAMTSALANASQPEDRPPNVLLILADDQGYADLSFLGVKDDVHTPRLDALAAAGTYLPTAYATSPICNPSRVGLITGQYQQRWNNFYYSGGDGLVAESVTLAERMQDAGYATGYFGKVHTGGPDRNPKAPGFPLNSGFDRFFGTTTGGRTHYLHHSKAAVEQYGESAKQNMVSPMWDDDEQIEFEGFTTTAFGEQARDFITENKEKPFFAMVAFNAVHNFAWQLPDEELEARGLDKFPDWDASKQPYLEWYKGVHRRDWPEGRVYYLAQLECLDREVGRLLDHLKALGVDDNTLVIYTVDNGGCVPDWADNGELAGSKYHLLEGGTRTPTIYSMPGVLPENNVIDSIVSGLDLAPTVCDIVGIETESNAFDGRSIVGLLKGEAEPDLQRELHWDIGWQWTVRSGDWKLMETPNVKEAKTEEGFEQVHIRFGVYLYNLAKDPGETTNLAEQMPEKVAELEEMHRAWRASVGKPLKEE